MPDLPLETSPLPPRRGAPAGLAAGDGLRQPGITLPQFPAPARRSHRRHWSFLIMVMLPTLIGAWYYLKVAAPQFLTQATVALRVGEEQRAGGAGPTSLTGSLGPSNSGAPVTQSYGIVNYLGSASAISDVTAMGIDVRAILTDPAADILVRLPQDASPEALLRAWRRMVNPQFETTRGMVTLTVRAFSPVDSLALAEALLRAGEQLSNEMSQRMFADRMRFAEEQVAQSQARFNAALDALQAFRAESGVVNPDQASSAGMAIEMQLRQELAAADAQAENLRAQGAQGSPVFAAAAARARALRAQLADAERQSSRGSGDRSGSAWAALLARSESLSATLRIAELHYTQSLALMQNTRAEVAQQRSYLLTFVRPVLASESEYPNRPLSILIVFGCALLIWATLTLFYHAIMDQM